jgi:hypothetical protein
LAFRYSHEFCHIIRSPKAQRSSILENKCLGMIYKMKGGLYFLAMSEGKKLLVISESINDRYTCGNYLL